MTYLTMMKHVRDQMPKRPDFMSSVGATFYPEMKRFKTIPPATCDSREAMVMNRVDGRGGTVTAVGARRLVCLSAVTLTDLIQAILWTTCCWPGRPRCRGAIRLNSQSSPTRSRDQAASWSTYCFECHGAKKQKGWI